MGDQHPEDAFVHQAFPDGNGNLPAQLYILPLTGPMHGAVADGQAIHTGFFEEFHRVHGIGVGAPSAKDVVFHAGQHPQLSLHRYTAGVGVLHHLAGQLDVILEGKAAAVNHNAGVSPRDGGLDAVHIPAVVQVKHHRHRAVLPEFLDCVPDVFGSPNLILQSGVHKIGTPPHETVCQVRPLQNSGRAEHLMDLDGGLGLGDRVDIKSSLGVTVLGGSLQQRPKWNQWHGVFLLFDDTDRIVTIELFLACLKKTPGCFRVVVRLLFIYL